VLKVSKIEDDGDNKITVHYSYSYEVDETTFEENVEVLIELGQTANKEVLLRF